MASKADLIFLFTTFASLLIVDAKICQESICEYEFVIHHTRTMTWKGPSKYYDVVMNGTKLQVIGNLNNQQPDENIGKFVNEDEVITADGFRKTVISINGQFPGPAIEVTEGAQVVVKVVNKLYREVVTIHWHGLTMKGTPWMDGVPHLSQCPIPPDQEFTYRFVANPVGTHWYHSHVHGQRIDGLFGLFVIHPKSGMSQMPEFPLIVGDWWHIDGNTMEVINPSSADPLDKGTGENVYIHPNFRDYSHDYVNAAALDWPSAIINGRGRHGNETQPLSKFIVKRRQKYRFRMVNVGAEFSFKVSIDGHFLRVISLDGHEIEPVEVDYIYINPGESIDFEFTANQIEGKYWLRAVTPHDHDSFTTYDGMTHGVNAIIVYDGIDPSGDPKSSPRPCTQTRKCMHFNCPFGVFPHINTKTCSNIDDVTSTYSADEITKEYGVGEKEDIHEIFLNIGYHIGSAINSRKMVMPTAPVFQKDSMIVDCEEKCKDSKTGCHCTNLIQIPFNKTIQIVFSNYQPVSYVGHHPMHLHGHSFAVLRTGFANLDSNTGRWTSPNSDVACNDDSKYCTDPMWNITNPLFSNARPAIKDTVHVPARGYAVIRFKSQNPGFWFFHCHMNHHLVNGMSAVFWEGKGYIPPPPEGMPTCQTFQYLREDYDKQMKRVNSYYKGSGKMEHYLETSKDSEEMGKDSEEADQPNQSGNKMAMDEDDTCPPKEGRVILKTADLIGCIIGCIVLGFILAILTVYMYIKCKDSQVEPHPEADPKSRF